MKASIGWVVLGLFVAGCSTPPRATGPEETAFLASVASEAVEFDIPKASADDAWGRAQVFIAKNASMKIQTATDFLVETYNPTPDAFMPSYGYRVTRSAAGDKMRFSVECFTGTEYSPGKLAQVPMQNAKILARFMRTGELPYPHLVAR